MKHCLNLLPAALQRRILLRHRLKQWAHVWGGGIVAALALYGGQLRQAAQSQSELQGWQRRAATVQSVEVRNLELSRKIADLKVRLNKYGRLENEGLGYQLLATISHSAGACGEKIQLHKLSFRQIQVPASVSEPKTPAVAGQPVPMRELRVLSLAGVASSNLSVSQFVSSLRDSAAFESVELKSTQGKRDTVSGPRSYQVECSF